MNFTPTGYRGADKDKEAMEEDYQKAMELIFAYDYGCCMLKHNICGDQPKVPNGMPNSFDPLLPEFFMNPRCPSARAPTKATKTEVEHSKMAEKENDPKRRAPVEDFSRTSKVPLFLIFVVIGLV